jgi:tight adherence protein B
MLIIFLLLTTVSFVILLVALKPSAEAKAVGVRMAAIASGSSVSLAAVNDPILRAQVTTKWDWIGNALSDTGLQSSIDHLILQAAVKTTAGAIEAAMAGLGLSLALAVYLVCGSVAIALIAFFVGAYLPLMFLKMKRNSRLKAFDKAMPDAIDMIARSLRAGHALPAALGIVAEQSLEPARTEFGEVFRQQNYGMTMRDALMQLLERVPSQDLRVLVTGVLVQRDTGGNLAEMLDKTVHVIRERIRIKGEIKTHTAQGRMTGWVLCALPAVMLLAINILNPGYSSPLLHTAFGHMMLYAGIGLLMLGAMTIRWIINGIEV